MKFEKAWVKSIAKDLKELSEEEFEQLNFEFEEVLESPNSKTKRVKGWPSNIRRIKFGSYRLLILVDDNTLTAYGLAFLPRKEAYSKKTRKAILELVRHLS